MYPGRSPGREEAPDGTLNMTMSPDPIRSNPMPPVNPWDKDYENTAFSLIYEPLWYMLQSFLDGVGRNTVLDFGCGDGTYACLMAERGSKVMGIDISEAAIKKAATRRCPQCSFIKSHCIPRDLPSHSFDVVVMLNSFHCLTHDHRQELLGQVRRVLKQRGHFFASVLSLDDESHPRQEWQTISPGTFVDDTGRLFHFFSAPELENELSWLNIQEIRALQNIHPACGRKSSLFVVTAQCSQQ